MPITQWAEDDKPREKLFNKGKAVLSNAELLAILLRSGSKGNSALKLAQLLLSSFDQKLLTLKDLSCADFTRFKGIGKAKSAVLVAAFELGRRIENIDSVPARYVQDSTSAYGILRAHLCDLEHEEFWILYLNNANKVIDTRQLSKGGITGTIVDVRLILKQALSLGSTAIIAAHNHPSGNLRPSRKDKMLTKKLREAAALVDIRLLDHLIVADSDYFSFADQNLI